MLKVRHAAFAIISQLVLTAFAVLLMRRVGLWGFFSSVAGGVVLGEITRPLLTKALVWWLPEVYAFICRCKHCRLRKEHQRMSAVIEAHLAMLVTELEEAGVPTAQIHAALRKAFP